MFCILKVKLCVHKISLLTKCSLTINPFNGQIPKDGFEFTRIYLPYNVKYTAF